MNYSSIIFKGANQCVTIVSVLNCIIVALFQYV